MQRLHTFHVADIILSSSLPSRHREYSFQPSNSSRVALTLEAESHGSYSPLLEPPPESIVYFFLVHAQTSQYFSTPKTCIVHHTELWREVRKMAIHKGITATAYFEQALSEKLAKDKADTKSSKK